MLSMSIARYVYLSMHEYFESDGYILKYSSVEQPKAVGEIRHRIIKQVFSDYGIKGVDFNSSADVPAGTGLGSSSAFTVGLLNLCNAYLGRYEGRHVLAAKACQIEIDKLGEPIGKQDQYGCALGGLNFIEFHPDDSVTYESVPLTHEARSRLENGLVMFYLGGNRSASEVLKRQAERVASSKQASGNLKAMVRQARGLRAEILKRCRYHRTLPARGLASEAQSRRRYFEPKDRRDLRACNRCRRDWRQIARGRRRWISSRVCARRGAGVRVRNLERVQTL